MNDFTITDLAMFKLEEKNILREMRGACSRGGHGPMVGQLLDKLNSVQTLIARYEAIIECDSKAKDVKKVNKVVAPTKATAK